MNEIFCHFNGGLSAEEGPVLVNVYYPNRLSVNKGNVPCPALSSYWSLAMDAEDAKMVHSHVAFTEISS